jgi:hypothetical protein
MKSEVSHARWSPEPYRIGMKLRNLRPRIAHFQSMGHTRDGMKVTPPHVRMADAPHVVQVIDFASDAPWLLAERLVAARSPDLFMYLMGA